MHRAAVVALSLTVAATCTAACVVAWCWRRPVRWTGGWS